MRTTVRTFAGIVFLTSSLSGQPLERNWIIGGNSNNQWSELSSLNILADDWSAPGALQPLELRPDENILPYIYSLYPFERHTVTYHPLWVEGMPRMWRGFGSLGPRGADMNAVHLYVDGDHRTLSFVTNYLSHKAWAEFYTFDMGGALPFERFVLQMPPAEETDRFGRPFEEYVPRFGELSGSWKGEQIPVEINYGEDYAVTNEFGELLKEDYRPLDVMLGQVFENRTAPIDVDFPPQYFRYVRWRTFPNQNIGRVTHEHLGYAEFELYGRGFANDASFQTTVVDLGQRAILGRVHFGVSKWRRVDSGWEDIVDAQGTLVGRRWREGELISAPDADAQAWVRVKTGSTDNPRSFFSYNDFGGLAEVDFETWNELKLRTLRYDPRIEGFQGPVTPNRQKWSPWSGPVQTSDSFLNQASGRYLQLMAEFRSNRPTDVARLDSVRIELFPVLVPTLLGEVGNPDRETTLAEVPLGEPAELVYAVTARFDRSPIRGFDALHIRTPSTPEFLGLRMGNPPTDAVVDGYEADASGLTLYLERPVVADETLFINVRTTLYSVSASLEGAVFQRGEVDLRQMIDEGNADEGIFTDKLQIVARNNIESAIDELTVQPRAFTPNGDGRNDQARITYILFGVRDVEVAITIYSLSGTSVRRFRVNQSSSGPSDPVLWDGRDQSGRLLPPGLYLCQVEINTSRGRDVLVSPVAIAY